MALASRKIIFIAISGKYCLTKQKNYFFSLKEKFFMIKLLYYLYFNFRGRTGYYIVFI